MDEVDKIDKIDRIGGITGLGRNRIPERDRAVD